MQKLKIKDRPSKRQMALALQWAETGKGPAPDSLAQRGFIWDIRAVVRWQSEMLVRCHKALEEMTKRLDALDTGWRNR